MKHAFTIGVEVGHDGEGLCRIATGPLLEAMTVHDAPGRGTATDDKWQISIHVDHATVLSKVNPQRTVLIPMRG